MFEGSLLRRSSPSEVPAPITACLNRDGFFGQHSARENGGGGGGGGGSGGGGRDRTH